MTFIIMSHNNGEGARALADRLGCRLAAHSSDKAFPSGVRVAINFGCSPDHPTYSRALKSPRLERLMNPVAAVHLASSKLASFQRFATYKRDRSNEFNFPPFYTNRTEANYACLVDGKTIVSRTIDRGSSGAGIRVLTPEEARAGQGLPEAGLYVEAIDKGREYRVHIGMTPSGSVRVIDVTRKIRRPEATGERGFVWNHDNDFMFVRDGVNPNTIPADLLQQANCAIQALGLTFGAVDIVVPRRGRNPISRMPSYVLEVNTAPGMEGTTVERYAQFFEVYYSGAGGVYPSWEGEAATSNEDDQN